MAAVGQSLNGRNPLLLGSFRGNTSDNTCLLSEVLLLVAHAVKSKALANTVLIVKRVCGINLLILFITPCVTLECRLCEPPRFYTAEP